MTNIFFTGAGGTGKTTLRDLMAPKLGLLVKESVSRSSPYTPGTEAHQEWIAGRILDDAIKTEKHLLDRTPFDVVAYDEAYRMKTTPRHSWFANYFAIEVKKLKSPVFYFPIYWEAEDDGFRPTDRKLLQLVDLTIKEQLDFYRIDYYTVPNRTPEDRLELAMEYLAERGITCQSIHTGLAQARL